MREWVEGKGAGRKRKVGEEREEGRKEGKEGECNVAQCKFLKNSLAPTASKPH